MHQHGVNCWNSAFTVGDWQENHIFLHRTQRVPLITTYVNIKEIIAWEKGPKISKKHQKTLSIGLPEKKRKKKQNKTLGPQAWCSLKEKETKTVNPAPSRQRPASQEHATQSKQESKSKALDHTTASNQASPKYWTNCTQHSKQVQALDYCTQHSKKVHSIGLLYTAQQASPKHWTTVHSTASKSKALGNCTPHSKQSSKQVQSIGPPNT